MRWNQTDCSICKVIHEGVIELFDVSVKLWNLARK